MFDSEHFGRVVIFINEFGVIDRRQSVLLYKALWIQLSFNA